MLMKYDIIIWDVTLVQIFPVLHEFLSKINYFIDFNMHLLVDHKLAKIVWQENLLISYVT